MNNNLQLTCVVALLVLHVLNILIIGNVVHAKLKHKKLISSSIDLTRKMLESNYLAL